MYVKPSRKQVRGMYVPDNYHGTAFTEPPIEQELPPEQAHDEQQPTPADAVGATKKEEGGLLSSLFSGVGNLRSDDLLLLALIVLLWSSKDEHNHGASELLPMLALLLFIG